MHRVGRIRTRPPAKVLMALTAGLLAFGVAPSLVPATADVSEPSSASYFAGQQSSRDVAVTSIVQSGPPFANEGDIVVIQVGVANNGHETETFQVQLVDDTAGETIATQAATLDGMTSSTVNMQWNTEGASGGPPPPGPPTPGTIHALTATVTLEGDANSSNNSMSLLPGIWIIAAPEPDGITFASGKSPQSTFGDGFTMEKPSVTTDHEGLTELFAASEEADAYTSLVLSDLSTSPESLTSPFSSTIAAKQGLEASDPTVSTSHQGLEGIFASPALQPSSSALARPGISTIATAYIPVRFSDTNAHSNLALSGPIVETSAEALDQVHFRQSLPADAAGVSEPNLKTELEPLKTPFGVQREARLEHNLANPQIGTDGGEPGRPLTLFEQASLNSATLAPEIETPSESNATVYHFPFVTDSPHALSPESILTSRSPATRINAWTAHSLYKEPLAIPSGSASKEELVGIFSGGGEVTYQPAKSLSAPFEEGGVRGTVLLQGSKNSLGAYVEIEGEAAFVDREGLFVVRAPDGIFDLNLRAPGHLSAAIKGIQVEPGQTLEIPTITLTFGDSNGDEVVDIYDLTVAARNYGQTALIVSLP